MGIKSFWKKDDSILISQNNTFCISQECTCGGYFIVGYCTKTNQQTELIPDEKDPVTGQLNTLYIVAKSKIYKTTEYYNNKFQYTLEGPFATIQLAQSHINSNSSQLLQDLTQKCSGNPLTIIYQWESSNGCDLDIRVELGNDCIETYRIWTKC